MNSPTPFVSPNRKDALHVRAPFCIKLMFAKEVDEFKYHFFTIKLTLTQQYVQLA